MTSTSTLTEFEALVAHLHDVHDLNATDMAIDAEWNGLSPQQVNEVRQMTREEALVALPYHYFMDSTVPRDSAAALASAQDKHAEECIADDVACDFPSTGAPVNMWPGTAPTDPLTR